jgi:hypothetical protein
MINPSLHDLANFLPTDSSENIIMGESVVAEYMATTKSSWSNGGYWLGGHLKLNPSDKLTPELFNKADKMMKDVGDYGCNSWENESIKDGKRQFDEIEVVVKRYREVMRRRILAELAKTPLNADVNEIIVSMF